MRRSLALSFSAVLAAAPSCGLRLQPIAPPYGERDSTIALPLRFALLFRNIKWKCYEKQRLVWEWKTDERKTFTLLNITMGDLLARFLERDRVTYLYARSGDGWRTTVQETWGGSMQSGLQFYGSCAASLRGAYVKKAERKVITTHSQGGYIWWNSTLKANSNKLLSEATLHFNLCVPPRCLRASGANHSRCRRPDTSNPTGTVRLTVIHNGLGTPQRSADGYGWPKCFEGLRLLLP